MDIYKKYNIKVDRNYKRSSKHRFYFYLRKLFFTTLGFFLKTIFKVSNKKPNKEVIILGRGKSTNYFASEISKAEPNIPINICFTIEKAINLAVEKSKEFKFGNCVILFSPSAASFDQFKNFEHRGLSFKEIVISKMKKDILTK